ncbi:integrase [Mesorhizobium sp. ASY16-5R]|uniref:integrase n=1 Tax=Mesorhizobium sp. ASY16-5R TaxID=3445772 RepID=UPI003FA16C2A
MASIRKHRDKYQVQIRRQGYPALSKSFNKLSDAKEWARLMETKADRKELGPDRKVLATLTLASLVQRYRDEILPRNKGGQVETIMLDAFLRHPICKKTLADLSTSDFTGYRDDRMSDGEGEKAITAKSVKRLLSPIQHMFSVAMEEWGVPLKENPLANFKLRVVDNKRQRRLLEGERDKLLQAGKKTQNPLVMLIVRLALETAMRRGEILALRWRDIDLERRSVTIREAKNGHSRTIPLTSAAIIVIGEAKGRTTENKIAENALVFPMAPNALLLSWNRLVGRAKLDDLHFHDLRHEAISRLFELGLTVPEVASISGHRTLGQLMRYAHANHSSIRAKLIAAE